MAVVSVFILGYVVGCVLGLLAVRVYARQVQVFLSRSHEDYDDRDEGRLKWSKKHGFGRGWTPHTETRDGEGE